MESSNQHNSSNNELLEKSTENLLRKKCLEIFRDDSAKLTALYGQILSYVPLPGRNIKSTLNTIAVWKSVRHSLVADMLDQMDVINLYHRDVYDPVEGSLAQHQQTVGRWQTYNKPKHIDAFNYFIKGEYKDKMNYLVKTFDKIMNDGDGIVDEGDSSVLLLLRSNIRQMIAESESNSTTRLLLLRASEVHKKEAIKIAAFYNDYDYKFKHNSGSFSGVKYNQCEQALKKILNFHNAFRDKYSNLKIIYDVFYENPDYEHYDLHRKYYKKEDFLKLVKYFIKGKYKKEWNLLKRQMGLFFPSSGNLTEEENSTNIPNSATLNLMCTHALNEYEKAIQTKEAKTILAFSRKNLDPNSPMALRQYEWLVKYNNLLSKFTNVTGDIHRFKYNYLIPNSTATPTTEEINKFIENYKYFSKDGFLKDINEVYEEYEILMRKLIENGNQLSESSLGESDERKLTYSTVRLMVKNAEKNYEEIIEKVMLVDNKLQIINYKSINSIEHREKLIEFIKRVRMFWTSLSNSIRDLKFQYTRNPEDFNEELFFKLYTYFAKKEYQEKWDGLKEEAKEFLNLDNLDNLKESTRLKERMEESGDHDEINRKTLNLLVVSAKKKYNVLFDKSSELTKLVYYSNLDGDLKHNLNLKITSFKREMYYAKFRLSNIYDDRTYKNWANETMGLCVYFIKDCLIEFNQLKDEVDKALNLK